MYGWVLMELEGFDRIKKKSSRYVGRNVIEYVSELIRIDHFGLNKLKYT